MTNANGEANNSSASAKTRPDRSRYVVVALLALGALIAFGSSAFLIAGAIDATAKSFSRSKIPGSITSGLHPGTWNVWLEGPGHIDSVTVTDSSGTTIDVHMGGGGTSYRRDGFEASKVASFEIPRGGMMDAAKVTVTGTAEYPEAAFAIGPADEFSYTDIARYGTIIVIAIDLLAMALIVIVPMIRARRSR